MSRKQGRGARFYREQRIARASDRVRRGWRQANHVVLGQLAVDLLVWGCCRHGMDDGGNLVRFDPASPAELGAVLKEPWKEGRR